jgi:hypothetical protein
MHCILMQWHPMIGCDFHLDSMPTPAGPVPSPWHPHLTAHVLNGWWLGVVADNETTMGIKIIHMNSDIANGIPHIPLPPTHFLLAALWTAFSGSKSYFGPSNVQTKKGPIGAALAVVVNPNLNCASAVPTPTGVVIAPNTVMAHMTLGDVIGGIFAMGSDALFSWIVGKISGGVVGGSGFGKVLGEALVGFMIGSPLGKTGLDIVKLVTPESWHPTINKLSYIPGFPGYGGQYAAGVGDGARWLGNKLGDGISGGETRTDRLWGRDGTYATDGAAADANRPADPAGSPNPASSVTDNPRTEDF